MKIDLTIAEVSHIITILEGVSEEGFYYGNKDQYYKRTNRIINKLVDVLVVKKGLKIV